MLALPETVAANELRERTGIGPGGPFSWVIGQPLPASTLRTYARECRFVAALPEQLETEVQALRIGDCAVVALPGEIFVELGLAIKAASPFRWMAPVESSRSAYQPERVTLLSSLSNDYVGYVPTRRAIEEEGGYETWAARSALPAAGTGEAMVRVASRLLATLAR
jgi:neutral ceramidase